MPTARFSVRCSGTRPGQAVGVAASWAGWAPAAELSGAAFPQWTGTLDLPAHGTAPLEYKFVVVEAGEVVRWEETPGGRNRVVAAPAADGGDVVVEGGVFGGDGGGGGGEGGGGGGGGGDVGGGGGGGGESGFLDGVEVGELDDFERALVEMHGAKKSWRLRLSFVREVFSDAEVAARVGFDPRSLDCLVSVAAYLSFLSSGQVACAEDNGHHRPNHHANEAAQIEAALDALAPRRGGDAPDDGWAAAYVARAIYPQLPSHASQFTVSVPLTRIRDIAHRGDIPHDMKQEIKHTLQNKIHRCCGPEDIRTCEKLLQRVENDGGYSSDFVHQLRVFYGELREFFNASSLDDRLQYLCDGAAGGSVASLAGSLLGLKHGFKPAFDQLKSVTELRVQLGDLLAANRANGEGGEAVGKEGSLAGEVVQKLRLADVELDSYAFTLLAAAAKDVEEGGLSSSDSWRFALDALGTGMLNMHLSFILGPETKAISSELCALAGQTASSSLDYLRIKAAVDRARRATEDFSTAITGAYTRRVASLSAALGVDRRAAAVLAEAVIRSTVTFQSSRIADATTKHVRSVLGSPAWDPLYVGEAGGAVVFVQSLAELAPSSDPVVAVCRKADGDEDIPGNVRGMVLGHALPHLSHLGVRARQSGVVFVCAEDPSVFEELWTGPTSSLSGPVKLVVSSTAGFEGLSADVVGSGNGTAKKTSSTPAENDTKTSVDIGEADMSDKKVLPLQSATKSNSSAKCSFAGKLATIADDSGLFVAPSGVCLPFGVYKAALAPHEAHIGKLITVYDAAAVAGETAAAASASADVRSSLESKLEVSPSILSAIQSMLPDSRVRVMVRSSANCEDLEDMSGAGLYDSIANVDPSSAEALGTAVRRVWASLWTQRAASSRAAYGVPHEKAFMAVLIQQMVTAEVSFIAFSHNPVDKSDSSSVYIELAIGMGETLASAASAGLPYRVRVDRDKPTAVTVDALASFGCALVPSADGAGEVTPTGLRRKIVDYSSERMTVDEEFRNAISTRIAGVVLELEAQLGGPQDVEGSITGIEAGNEAKCAKLFIVQARPQIL